MELPFKNIAWGEEKEKFEKRVANIKKEKILGEDSIKEILIKKAKSVGLLYTSEKNVRGINENPFDLVFGDEKELLLCGFEIKSDKDSFIRLKDQLRAYMFVFKEVFIVLHKKKKPEWLPNNVGVIRVFEDGECYIEEGSWLTDPLDISTDYEWDALFKSNGLGNTSKKTREVLELIGSVRRNILFNRFFAVSSGLNTKSFDKFYPLTDKQKTLLIGFDVPYHYRKIKKDITEVERRLVALKEACMLGQKGLKDYGKSTHK